MRYWLGTMLSDLLFLSLHLFNVHAVKTPYRETHAVCCHFFFNMIKLAHLLELVVSSSKLRKTKKDVARV